MIIQGTHRAYMGANTHLSAWVRDERVRHDLTQYDAINVEIKRDVPGKAGLTIPADGTEQGRLDFTITAEAAGRRLRVGPYTLRAIADGRVIYTGRLEVA